MANDYRDRAAECLRLANDSGDSTRGAILLDMALAWLRLADQAERNSQVDLIYETPLRSVSQPMQQQQQRAKDDE
jgi:hypothetical protein